MEIVIELPKDIDKLCRTCMNIVEDDQKNCIANDDDDDQSADLNKMLLYLTGTDAPADECLPKFMCNDCVRKLEIAYFFKQQCQNTYLSLHDIMVSGENDLKSDICEFICSTCEMCFSTQYKLSKHEFTHYSNGSLFTRFKYNDDQDLKSCLITNSEQEILTLVKERKEYSENKTKILTIKEIENNCKLDILPDKFEHICDLCNRQFHSALSLHLHFINHAILVEADTEPDIFDQYFLCCVCGEIFNCSGDLENHVLKCNQELHEFRCVQCNETFNNELNLLRHEKEFLHSNKVSWEKHIVKTCINDVYKCPICEEKFSGIVELSVHSVRHIIKKITCRICKKTFSCQLAHNNHLKSHNYKHMCNLCGKWLGSRHALKTHIMGVHSAIKNFICSVCAKAFKTPSRLYIHNLTHRKDKKFICTICNYKTNYVGDFRVHSRIHTAERPYKCNFVNCKRQFKTSSHLNEHIQRHLQIKKYQCNTCYMVFGHNHTLKMHLMVHTGEKPFSCSVCKIKFRRKHHLKNHMKQHTNVEGTVSSEKLSS